MELEMDEDMKELRREQKRFHDAVERARPGFGLWDMCCPVAAALVRAVQAQNNLTHAIEEVENYGEDERLVEEAIAERIEAIAALQKAIEQEPRGFQ